MAEPLHGGTYNECRLASVRESVNNPEEEDEESLYDVSTRMSRADRDSSDEPLGVRRWRRELKRAVADYVIVFLRGILWEFPCNGVLCLSRLYVKTFA